MIVPVFRTLFAVAIAVGTLAGCATAPKGMSQEGIPQAEAKLLEANSALDSANEQSAAFYAQFGEIQQEIKEFCGRPGWAEFEQVLLEYPSLRDVDNEIEITPEIEARLIAWGEKWKTSWREMLADYRGLVDKCIIMEAKRLATRERVLAVQAKYLGAVLLEVAAGREEQGKAIYSLMELLDSSGAELNSHQTDELGLYRVK